MASSVMNVSTRNVIEGRGTESRKSFLTATQASQKDLPVDASPTLCITFQITASRTRPEPLEVTSKGWSQGVNRYNRWWVSVSSLN